jgi:hypothetical protein
MEHRWNDSGRGNPCARCNTCYFTLSTFPAANCLGLNPVPRRERPARSTAGAPLCLEGVLAERREQDRGMKGIQNGLKLRK